MTTGIPTSGARVAWLVWPDSDDEVPEIRFVEPERWYSRVKMIIYFEVQTP